MALHTVSELRDSVAGILSGIDISTVADLNGCFTRAVSNMLQQADVPEASGIQNITLYSGVFDYACNSKIFGTAVNDLRPQGITRNPNNFVSKVDQEDFDRTKQWWSWPGTRITFQYTNGSPTIRIVAPFPKTQAIIDPMSTIGTSPTQWVASGSASALTVDNTTFYESPASLRFLLTGSSTGILTRTEQSTIDISDYEDVGVAFLAIMIPDGSTATNLTSIELRLGSSSTNYNNVSNTTGFLGSWIAGQWLIVAFDFSTASETGTPNWSAINYVQIRLAHTATFTNFRVGGLWMSMPTPAQILYQSAAVFLPTGTTVPLTTITATSDEIILTDPAYNIYLHESALTVLQNTGATATDSTSAKINQTLHGTRARNGVMIQAGLYDMYRGDNPSQEIRTTGSWYETGQNYNSNGWYN